MKLAALLVLALAAGPGQDDPAHLRYGISAERIDGEVWCTIAAEDAPLRPLLETLAERAGLTIEGLGRVPAELRVSVFLEQRPLPQAIEWMLGSVGLRADRRRDTLTLRVEGHEREDLWTEAQAAYFRALRRWPNHPDAPLAVLGQAQLEEDRGNRPAARAHYERLVEGWPDSKLVPGALRRTAELWAVDREWSFAAQKWSELLRIEREHEHETVAYTELARCTALLGDSERTLFMLDALENLSPAEGEDEAQTRLYIRARALVGAHRHHHALEALDEADLAERTPAEERDSYEVRALALSGIGRDADASRAWLAFAQRAEGADRAHGLRQAAELALGAGDELSVLFIEQLAARLGEAGAVDAIAREARALLELDDPLLAEVDPLQRLERAERLLDGGMQDEAHDLLESIHSSSARFAEPDTVRFLIAFARTLAARAGADAAVDVLRNNLENVQDAEHRRRIYLLAAELLEAEERYEDAIEAYQGRL